MGQLEDDNNEGYVTGMNKWNDYQDTDTYGNYMQDISEYHLGPSQDDLTVIKTTTQQRINVLPQNQLQSYNKQENRSSFGLFAQNSKEFVKSSGTPLELATNRQGSFGP